MRRNIEIYEFEMVPDVRGYGQTVKVEKMKGPDKQISEQGVDEALLKAREIVAGMKLKIRSINMTTNGAIRVVVHKPGARRAASRQGGMVYRRPPKTAGLDV